MNTFPGDFKKMETMIFNIHPAGRACAPGVAPEKRGHAKKNGGRWRREEGNSRFPGQ